MKSSGGDKTHIGRLLKRKNLITDDQLQEALNVQRQRLYKLGQSDHLGQILVDLGYVSEREVVTAINQHYRLSVTSLSDDINELIKEKRGRFFERFSFPSIPIWLQLSFVAIFLIIISSFSLSVVMLRQQKEQLYQQTVKIGMVSLNYFTNDARIPLLEDNILRLNTLIKEAGYVDGILYAAIVDNNQRIKAHTDHNQIGEKFEPFDNVENETHEGKVTYFTYNDLTGKRLLNLSRSILFKNKKLGEVHVGVSLDFIQQLFHERTLSIIILTSVILFFGVLIAIWFGIHFSRPISELAKATEEISKGNYKYYVRLIRNDELGNLARAFNQMSRKLRLNTLMQKSFGKYVGAEVLEMIMANPESAWLKGHRNEASIIFIDIRGFTAYSEANEPEDIVEKLNDYFEIATNIILRHGGYVDKFIGDAVLGVFGVPVYHEDHMERAVRAALDMQRQLKECSRNGNPLLAAVGISINAGVVVSGNIGSQIKMEYTVIGDSVNVASRLNGLAGSGEIIISKNIHDKLKGMIEMEARRPQKIKGKSEPVETFKVLGYKKA